MTSVRTIIILLILSALGASHACTPSWWEHDRNKVVMSWSRRRCDPHATIGAGQNNCSGFIWIDANFPGTEKPLAKLLEEDPNKICNICGPRCKRYCHSNYFQMCCIYSASRRRRSVSPVEGPIPDFRQN